MPELVGPDDIGNEQKFPAYLRVYHFTRGHRILGAMWDGPNHIVVTAELVTGRRRKYYWTKNFLGWHMDESLPD